MGWPMGRPVAASHSRAVLSQLPVRIVLPSGLNATEYTMLECARGSPSGRPVAASHSRAVLSSAPGEDRLAVGAERHGEHPVRMLHGLAEWPAGGGVPQPRRLVTAPGEDRLAVRAERRGRDTMSGCSMGWPMGRPVAASHSRAVLSLLPVRIVLPSGLKATARHRVTVGEDLLQLDVVAPPGRQVGQGDVLAGLVSRLGRHP